MECPIRNFSLAAHANGVFRHIDGFVGFRGVATKLASFFCICLDHRLLAGFWRDLSIVLSIRLFHAEQFLHLNTKNTSNTSQATPPKMRELLSQGCERGREA